MANNDRTVHPDLQRFVAKRMGASVHAIDSNHVPMLSHPSFVVDVIRAGGKSSSWIIRCSLSRVSAISAESKTESSWKEKSSQHEAFPP